MFSVSIRAGRTFISGGGFYRGKEAAPTATLFCSWPEASSYGGAMNYGEI